jgi:hypothetical protein
MVPLVNYISRIWLFFILCFTLYFAKVYFIASTKLKARKKLKFKKYIGFFHPFSEFGGGAERVILNRRKNIYIRDLVKPLLTVLFVQVLWCAIFYLQNLYPDLKIVVYTGCLFIIISIKPYTS